MKYTFDDYFMDLAKRTAKQSYCKRAKVGAIIVKDKRIIATGYNGTISGFKNQCENGKLTDHSVVVHAEQNAIIQCARNGVSTVGSTMYCTYTPCEECAKLILQSGVKEFVYLKEYKKKRGLKLLKQKIKVRRYND